MILFVRELSQESRKATGPAPGEIEPSLHGEFLSTYQASGREEEIVSHVTSGPENVTKPSDITIELVDFHLKLWYKTTQHAVLTRTIQSLAEDDVFASGVAPSQKRKVVFLFYGRTGIAERMTWRVPRLITSYSVQLA